MPQESPTRRGFKTVMLSDEAYGALRSFKERNGLMHSARRSSGR